MSDGDGKYKRGLVSLVLQSFPTVRKKLNYKINKIKSFSEHFLVCEEQIQALIIEINYKKHNPYLTSLQSVFLESSVRASLCG